MAEEVCSWCGDKPEPGDKFPCYRWIHPLGIGRRKAKAICDSCLPEASIESQEYRLVYDKVAR